MKTPCLTSSTTVMTTKNETLNLFDSYRRSTSVMKILTTATTIPAYILTTTTSIFIDYSCHNVSAVELLIVNDKIKLMELNKKLD
ncbi:unnamed protein product [Rotaria sordida]|uniref:Uncharacterized protein n=2 Tax=Rotaria sordida TaxID=392033 RepID=A0A815ZIJ6_9BILA|nr:unnamed protein product [Rotaria sordida]CAF1583264.1 unnamed protein product [Rotaria sordida]